jgi:hypothetical protein
MTVHNAAVASERRSQFRVDWLPGTDVLHGACECGASTEADDPVTLWSWLLKHREAHSP